LKSFLLGWRLLLEPECPVVEGRRVLFNFFFVVLQNIQNFCLDPDPDLATPGSGFSKMPLDQDLVNTDPKHCLRATRLLEKEQRNQVKRLLYIRHVQDALADLYHQPSSCTQDIGFGSIKAVFRLSGYTLTLFQVLNLRYGTKKSCF
jgi:hypothetical protein